MALLAEAFVRIRPSIAGFRTELEKELRTIIPTVRAPKVGVGALPDLRGFRVEMQTALKEVGALTPIRVGATPDLTGFRTELNTALREVQATPIKVTVIPVTGAATTAAVTDTAGLAAGANAQAQQAAKTVTSNTAVTEAVKARNLAIDKVLIAESKLNEVEIAGIKSSTALASAQARATAAISANAAAMDAYKVAVASGDAATVSLATSLAATTAAEEAFRIAQIGTVKALSIRNVAIDRILSAETKLAAVSQAGATASSELTAAQARAAAATAANAKAMRAYTAAVLSGDEATIAMATTLARNTALAEANAVAMVNDARAQGEAAAATEAHAVALRGLNRGFATSILGAIGLRSATLAASGPFIAGAAGAIALGASLKVFADFQKQLNIFQVTAGATAQQLENVRKRAIALGADVKLPGVSAGDAAKAMTELARAGFTVNQVLAATPGVLQLATAAQIDFASAAQITASSLKAFDLPAKDAAQVVDILAKAANASLASIQDMTLALEQSEAVAHLAGLSFKDTTVLLTELSNAGLKGSDAGTSLRTALIRLLNPTKQVRDALDALGVQVTDVQGRINPRIFEQIQQSINQLPPGIQKTITAVLGGSDAIRTFGLLGQQSFDKTNQKLNEAAGAQATTEAATKGLSGAVGQLGSNVENLGITLGQDFAPAAGVFIAAMNQIVLVTEKAAEAVNFLIKQFPSNTLTLAPGFTGLTAELKALQAQADSLGSGPLKDQIEKDIESVHAAIVKLNLATRPDEGTRGVLANQGQAVVDLAKAQATAVGIIGDTLKNQLQQFTGVQLGPTKIPAQIRQLINQLAALGPEGKAKLRQLGAQLSDAMAQGITDNRAEAISAARQNVADAVAAAQETVRSAVQSARSNLESLGDTISGDITRIFEAAPTAAAKALDTLRKSLAALQDQANKRSLAFDLSQAQKDLAEARQSLFQPQAATPEQQAAITDFLAPLRERVADAKTAIREANLQDEITKQENAVQRQQKAAADQIAKIVTQFETGKINARQFTEEINAQLAPALRKLPKANLGFAFTRDFKREIQTLLVQAQELSGFLGTSGTTPGPQPVNVQAAANQAQKRVDEAKANLQKQLNANEKTAQNTTDMKRLLVLIDEKLKPPAPKRGRSTGATTPSSAGAGG